MSKYSFTPQQAVQHLTQELRAGAKKTMPMWELGGRLGAGKSSVLEQLREALPAKGLRPVLVAPPRFAADAGTVALMQVATGLKGHGLMNGQLDQLTNPRLCWDEKLNLVQSAIEAANDKVVLLCDDGWNSPHEFDEHSALETHVRHLMALLPWSGARMVTTGQAPGLMAPGRVWIEPTPAGSLWKHTANWGSLAAVAGTLAERWPQATTLTALEARLLVAAAICESLSDDSQPPPRPELWHRLRRALASQPGFETLNAIWARLAFVRVGFGGDLLDQVGVDQLSATQRDLLERCLLSKRGGKFFVHESLRASGDASNDTNAHHRWLAGYHMRLLARAHDQNAPEALLAEMEAYYHASEAGDVAICRSLRLFSPDQLNGLGKALSLTGRHAEAVEVFDQALSLDADDKYAHHYKAFNLDVRGVAPDLVERHYRAAVELDKKNIWWCSRLVTFLITRGRIADARQAWSESLDALGLPDAGADPSVYENFHLWVARLLLDGSQLDFLEEVLHGVPATVRSDHVGFRAIERRCRAIREARRARAVFPLTIPPDDWWRGGPHLHSRRQADGKPLVSWLPGRVESIDDDDGVTLVVAKEAANGSVTPAHYYVTLSSHDFDRASRDERSGELAPGRFVELAFYGDQEELVVRVHRNEPWWDSDLPQLKPDPQRYLITDGWVT